MPELATHVREIGGTVLFLVPTMIRRLLDENIPGLALPTLRVLISSGVGAAPGGAVGDPPTRLTPNLFEFYSSTEGGGVSVLTPADCDLHPDSVGRPAFRVEVEIVDEDHQPLPPDSVAAVCATAAPPPRAATGTPMAGDAFRDGWFYPGDLARLDADGFLYLHGRAKDMIIRGGVNIYPQDIERIIAEIPGVRDVAVAGAPSREMGEEVAAFVVADGSVTAEMVAAACRSRLAPYKAPSIVRFLPELPRNAGGKVLKNALLAGLEQADAR